MTTSSPKPKTPCKESGKKFCACFFAFSESVVPPSLGPKHQISRTSGRAGKWDILRGLFLQPKHTHTFPYICTYSQILHVFSGVLWSQKPMFISQPFLVWGCFQPPTPTSYLPYFWSHHHLLPWEPLRNHRSGYNVPFAINTNVGMMLVLPTAEDQSAGAVLIRASS